MKDAKETGVGWIFLRPQVVVAIVLLIMITGTAYTLTLPPKYEGLCIAQVIFPEGAGSKYDEASLQALTRTQAELMGSRTLFDKVIENLSLQQAWGAEINEDEAPISREQAVALLQGAVRITAPDRTPGLVEVRAYWNDPETAARLANEIAAAYRDLTFKLSVQEGGVTVRVADPASPATRPVSPNVVLNVSLLAAVGSLWIVASLAFGRRSAAADPRSAGREWPAR